MLEDRKIRCNYIVKNTSGDYRDYIFHDKSFIRDNLLNTYEMLESNSLKGIPPGFELEGYFLYGALDERATVISITISFAGGYITIYPIHLKGSG